MIKRSKFILAVIHRRSSIPVGIIVTRSVAQVQIAQNGVNSAHVLDGLFNLFEASGVRRGVVVDRLRQVFGHERIRSNSRATSRWRELVANKLSPIVATRNFAKFIHVRFKILQIIIPEFIGHRYDELVFDVLRALGEIIRSDRFRHAVKISRFLNSRIVVDGIHQPIPTNL